MSILITAANSAKAHQLKNKITDSIVVLGDYLTLPDFMVKTGAMLRLPNPQVNTYTHQMLALCLDNSITAIYPLNVSEAKLLVESMQLFKEYGIEIHITDNDL